MCACAHPKPLGVKDCLEYMKAYVKKHSLLPIFGKDLKEEELDDILRPYAEVASQLPLKLDNIRKELLMRFTVMGLYDLVVLIGMFPLSSHPNFNEQCINMFNQMILSPWSLTNAECARWL